MKLSYSKPKHLRRLYYRYNSLAYNNKDGIYITFEWKKHYYNAESWRVVNKKRCNITLVSTNHGAEFSYNRGFSVHKDGSFIDLETGLKYNLLDFLLSLNYVIDELHASLAQFPYTLELKRLK